VEVVSDPTMTTRLIHSQAGQLNAELKMENHGGARVELLFPAAQA